MAHAALLVLGCTKRRKLTSQENQEHAGTWYMRIRIFAFTGYRHITPVSREMSNQNVHLFGV